MIAAYQNVFGGVGTQAFAPQPSFNFGPIGTGPVAAANGLAANPASLLTGLAALILVAGEIGGGFQNFVGAPPQQGPPPQFFSPPQQFYPQPQFYAQPQYYAAPAFASAGVSPLSLGAPSLSSAVAVTSSPIAMLPAGVGSFF